MKLSAEQSIGVIGAGAMGAGIAQVAATAGHAVYLYDAQAGAAEAGRDRIASWLTKRANQGKLDASVAKGISDRIKVVSDLGGMVSAALIVEAIVENLEVKRTVFAEIEDIFAEDTILATNTSSISITAIGAGLKRPERLVGMHFFNPAPIMKLVEVVSGLATAPDIARTTYETAQSWGKVAVYAKSTPGFIVNRVARAYYGEPLRLAEEGVADPATLDALMREGGGFRMGPFELMDLIGHDVNYAVSRSVFAAFHYEPRFRPSLLQQELVDAGHLGRKSGQGFYSYAPAAVAPAVSTVAPDDTAKQWEWWPLSSDVERDGVLIALTDGRTAAERAREAGKPVILCDLCNVGVAAGRLGFTTSPDVPSTAVASLVATLASQRISATQLPDWPALVVLRTLALIINEAFEAILQGVGDEDNIDLAMRFGVNYPRGPVGWGREIGLTRIVYLLDNLRDATGDMRYRASYALRRSAET